MNDLPQASFLLDENVDVHLANYLRNQGYKAAICPKGLTDKQVTLLATQEKSILITNDKDFANSDLYKPDKTWGIVILRVHPATLENNQMVLEKLFKAIKSKDLYGKIVMLTRESAEVIE